MVRTLGGGADSREVRRPAVRLCGCSARRRSADGILTHWIDQDGGRPWRGPGACRSRRRRSPTWPSGPGVSRQTVSNAVNNPELLRPDTLARVQDAIAELGLLAQPGGAQPAHPRLHLIGLKFNPAQEGTANAAMDRFVHTLVETSGESGYHVLLFSGTPDDPVGGYDDLLRSTAVDAFIVTDTYLGNPQAAWLTSAAGPVRGVRPAVGRPRRDPPVGRRRRRRRRRAGHRAPARQGPHPDRVDRLAQGLLHRRGPTLGLDPRHARPRPADHRARRRASRTPSPAGARPRRCCSTRPRRPAFVCASDTLALGVLHTLGDRGIHWGKDIAVVGFDDSQVSQVVPGGLTSVRQPLEQVAVELVKALEGLLSTPPVAGPGVLLTPTLAVRLSSG